MMNKLSLKSQNAGKFHFPAFDVEFGKVNNICWPREEDRKLCSHLLFDLLKEEIKVDEYLYIGIIERYKKIISMGKINLNVEGVRVSLKKNDSVKLIREQGFLFESHLSWAQTPLKILILSHFLSKEAVIMYDTIGLDNEGISKVDSFIKSAIRTESIFFRFWFGVPPSNVPCVLISSIESR